MVILSSEDSKDIIAIDHNLGLLSGFEFNNVILINCAVQSMTKINIGRLIVINSEIKFMYNLNIDKLLIINSEVYQLGLMRTDVITNRLILLNSYVHNIELTTCDKLSMSCCRIRHMHINNAHAIVYNSKIANILLYPSIQLLMLISEVAKIYSYPYDLCNINMNMCIIDKFNELIGMCEFN